MYVLIIQAMQRPVLGGFVELVHSSGEVMDVKRNKLHVRGYSEMWNTESDDSLHRGDRGKVVGITGLILRVRRIDDGENEAQTS